MKKRNIVFGSLFLLGGYWLFKNFLNKKVEAEKPQIDLPETPQEELKSLKSRENLYRMYYADPTPTHSGGTLNPYQGEVTNQMVNDWITYLNNGGGTGFVG